MSGYVYVVGNSVSSKIGYSANPKERVKVISKMYFGESNPDVYVSAKSGKALDWESRCHDFLDPFVISNELFSVGFNSAVSLVEKLKPKDDEIACELTVLSEIKNGDYSNTVSLINNCEKIELKSEVLGDLTSLWQAGNIARMQEGKGSANLTKFLLSSKTKEFIEVCKSKGCENPIFINGVGNKKRTWASIHFMVYAAEHLSVNFHFHVIDAFVKGKITKYNSELIIKA